MMSFLTCFLIGYMLPSCCGNLPLDDYSKKGRQTNIEVDCNNETVLVNDALTLTVDFTDSSKKNCKIYNVWSVANRISPQAGSNVREGLSINLIRMLGGILKDKKPYYDYDVCKYNQQTGNYDYDFTPLFTRLDKIINSGTPIQQFVLDQPDWAFQQGYKFIPTGTSDGKNFRENEKQSIYGNSLPPSDKRAYADFISELMSRLIDRYGRDMVASWQFRIGSEIETPDHWFGTKQEFIEHFKNVAKVVRSVLPEAKIGPHTREYDFVYSKNNYLNYKGEKVTSFANEILSQCKDENIKIDFWGVSDYVMVNNKDSRNIPAKYNELFGKFINDPNWNSSTKLDLMEYSAIVSMGAAGNTFINCVTSHTPVLELCLTNQFYKYHNKGLRYIYRWGNRTDQKEATHIRMLNKMVGMQGYNATVEGTPKTADNVVDAISATSDNGEFNVIVYNYNVESLDYSDTDEPVNIILETSLSSGTKVRYRSLSYSAVNNKANLYLEKYGTQFHKTEKGIDEKGNPEQCLNSTGLGLYNAIPEPKEYDESDWKEVIVKQDPENKDKRIILITTTLPSFSYKMFEFKKQ